MQEGTQTIGAFNARPDLVCKNLQYGIELVCVGVSFSEVKRVSFR